MPPATILSEETGLTSLVGTASTTLEFEEGLMQLGNLRIDLSTGTELADFGWQLSGISIKFEAHPLKQDLFMNQNLNYG